MLHSTRGGAATPELEFQATLNWFAAVTSQVSAHVVIAADGTVAECVNPERAAQHARGLNLTHLGVEVVQPRPGDPITAEQYRSLAWWLRKMAGQFGFALSPETLPEHRLTESGKAEGKSDIGDPFDLDRLLAMVRI